MAKTGIELIAEERERQIRVEGYSAEYDDKHNAHKELSMAGACYILKSTYQPRGSSEIPSLWPWTQRWWKPGPPVRMLVKAGALIAAEIDRLQRLECRTAQGEEGAGERKG